MKIEDLQEFLATTGTELAIKVLAAVAFWIIGRWLKAAVASIPNVDTDPAPEITLLDFRLEGPQIAVRPYTHTGDYWQVWFDTNEAIARVGAEAGWPAPASSHRVQQVLP